MAWELVCLMRVTNILEPLGVGIPEALSHFLSVCLQGFQIPGESNRFWSIPSNDYITLGYGHSWMGPPQNKSTCLPTFMYYINMKPQLPEYHLIHSTSLSLSSWELLIVSSRHQSSICIDSLRNILSYIIHANIASCSCGLRSYCT